MPLDTAAPEASRQLARIVQEEMVLRCPYEVLGVARGANYDTTIRPRFLKLAKDFHPDYNRGDKFAEKLFKELTWAHEILRDPAKRALYDRRGLAAFGARDGGDGGIVGAWAEAVMSFLMPMDLETRVMAFNMSPVPPPILIFAPPPFVLNFHAFYLQAAAGDKGAVHRLLNNANPRNNLDVLRLHHAVSLRDALFAQDPETVVTAYIAAFNRSSTRMLYGSETASLAADLEGFLKSDPGLAPRLRAELDPKKYRGLSLSDQLDAIPLPRALPAPDRGVARRKKAADGHDHLHIQ